MANDNWPWWPLLPLYPYGQRKTLCRELIPGQIWALEQLQGVFYVAVPIRMFVVKIEGGLLLYGAVFVDMIAAPYRALHSARRHSRRNPRRSHRCSTTCRQVIVSTLPVRSGIESRFARVTATCG